MANNQNQKNRDDVTTNNQKTAQQDSHKNTDEQRNASGNEQNQQCKEAPRVNDGGNTR